MGSQTRSAVRLPVQSLGGGDWSLGGMTMLLLETSASLYEIPFESRQVHRVFWGGNVVLHRMFLENGYIEPWDLPQCSES